MPKAKFYYFMKPKNNHSLTLVIREAWGDFKRNFLRSGLPSMHRFIRFNKEVLALAAKFQIWKCVFEFFSARCPPIIA